MQTTITKRIGWRLSEIAKATGLKYQWLFNQYKKGTLKARKIGGILWVPDEELQRFLKEGE